MSNELPNEIWLQIVSQIPSSKLAELYELNSFFFTVAFRERYKRFDFTIARFSRLVDLRPKLVRELIMMPLPFGDHFYFPDRIPQSTLSRLLPTISFNSTNVSGDKRHGEEVLSTIRTLTNVEDFLLKIELSDLVTVLEPQGDLRRIDAVLPMLDAAHETFGGNVRRLTVAAPLEAAFPALRRPHNFFFPKLEVLTLEMVYMEGTQENLVDLIPLVNRHQQTLHTLKIDRLQQGPGFYPFFVALNLPALRTLSFPFYPNTDGTAYGIFLQNHFTHLQFLHIRIPFHARPANFRMHLIVSLPALRTLKLTSLVPRTPETSPSLCDDLSHFIQSHMANLETLTVNLHMYPTPLANALIGISAPTTYPRLTQLVIYVTYLLQTDLLNKILLTFPGLSTLDVRLTRYPSIEPNVQRELAAIAELERGIDNIMFAGTRHPKLRHLTVGLTNVLGDSASGYAYHTQLLRLVALFPHIQTLNSHPVELYIPGMWLVELQPDPKEFGCGL